MYAPKQANTGRICFLEVVKQGFVKDCKRMMSYPQFNGGPDEDVVFFLENLELACISNHIENQAQIL